MGVREVCWIADSEGIFICTWDIGIGLGVDCKEAWVGSERRERGLEVSMEVIWPLASQATMVTPPLTPQINKKKYILVYKYILADQAIMVTCQTKVTPQSQKGSKTFVPEWFAYLIFFINVTNILMFFSRRCAFSHWERQRDCYNVYLNLVSMTNIRYDYLQTFT